jgi:hypothetical protein
LLGGDRIALRQRLLACPLQAGAAGAHARPLVTQRLHGLGALLAEGRIQGGRVRIARPRQRVEQGLGQPPGGIRVQR